MGFALLLLLQAAPLPDSEISDLFDEILRRRRRTYGSQVCGTRDGWPSADDYQRLLFVSAFPEKVERFARRIIEDPEAIPWDIVFVLGMVPRLSDQTSPEMEAHLVRLARHHESVVVDMAVERMSSLHGIRRHRELLQQLCAEGETTAFAALSFDAHPGTIRFLTELELQERQDPRFDTRQISRQSRHALEGIRILESADWRKKLEVLLREKERSERTDWAEDAADRLAPELLVPLYRRRVEADRGKLAWKPPVSFVRGVALKVPSDDYDFNLLVFSELGGDLTPQEKKRLIRFGFLGDAGKRLAGYLRETSKYFP